MNNKNLHNDMIHELKLKINDLLEELEIVLKYIENIR